MGEGSRRFRVEEAELWVGEQVFDKTYRLEQLLGRGAYGAVYQSWDPLLRRKVAIKIIVADKEEQRRSALAEAQAMGKLEHAHLVAIHRAGMVLGGDALGMVMTFCARGSLDRCGALDPIRAADYVRQAALGVGVMHEQGLVHRDIKPANLLLDADGVVKVGDLGLVRTEAWLAQQGGRGGTPVYMSPEQTTFIGAVTSRSDVFSLGATLCQLVTGEPPSYPGGGLREVLAAVGKGPFPMPEFDEQQLPPGLRRIMMRATEHAPSRRYATGGELARDLEDWLRDRQAPQPRRVSCSFSLVLALALLLSVGATWAIWRWGNPGGKAWPALPATFEVVDPAVGAEGLPRVIEHAESGVRLCLIPPGGFQMGASDEELFRDDERPRHYVEFTRPFYMARTELTNEEWLALMPELPSRDPSPRLPVSRVTWDEIQQWLAAAGERWSLPSEAQWEYACRADGVGWWNSGDELTAEHAVFDREWEEGVLPVGEREPNRWGLHDMHGNVWERCADDWVREYEAGRVTDPPPTQVEPDRREHTSRGGGLNNTAEDCRSARRLEVRDDQRAGDQGFRPIWTPPLPSE